MKRLTDDEAADLIVFALYDGLSQNIPVRDQVMAGHTPAQREEVDAACARQRERVHTLNTRKH